MKIDWHFQGFVSSREDDKIVGGVLRLIGSVPPLHYTYPIYDHPDDKGVTEEGISWVRKPPVWDEELDRWLRGQNEIAAQCGSFEEYVKTARTMIGITK